MTMQRPISNNDVDCGPPTTQQAIRSSSDGLGALSAAAAANSPSALAAATTTALGLLTNGSNNSDPHNPSLTSLSRNGSMGSVYSQSSHGLWGGSSTLSSVPLLSPSELTSASEGKVNSNGNGNSNDHIQALFLAQMRQRLLQQQQQQEQGQQQLRSESHLQPKKRQRTMMMESSESSLSKALESGSPFLHGGPSNALSAGELGLATGGWPSSLLRTASNVMSAPGNASTLGGLSNLLSPSVADLNNAFSSNGGISANGNNMTQIQKLLRKQQLQELQQLQQLKQREDMQRISQLQSRDAVLQLMLQQQQQQQQQQALSIGNGNASLAAQLKLLQDQQEQQQNNARSHSSPINEETVASYMRRNSQNKQNGMANGGSQPNNMLQQMQALANRQQLEQQQDNDGMPPPPPMVSAVSSLDSVAIMSMLLPSNQQNHQQHQHQQQSSSNSAASRLLGTEFPLGVANGGLGGGSNFNHSMLSPMPFPQPSTLNFGMGGNAAASLFGGLGGIPGSNGLSSMMGRAGTNAICPSAPGLALHPSAADVIYEQRRLAAAAEVSNTVRDSSVGKPPDAFVDRDLDGRARDLPTLLVVPMDHMQLSSHQTLLRYQIEVFRAGEEDTSTHTRGRNKPVQLGQIGIRCRHCKVLPVSRRKRGSVYFPRAVEGFYQAAQNMNSTHLQTGECPLMGNALRQEFANLIATRGVSTGAGRAYWAKQARKLGLRNTENGIVFDKKEPGGTGSGGGKPSETSKSSTD
jgi:hypothetical protein